MKTRLLAVDQGKPGSRGIVCGAARQVIAMAQRAPVVRRARSR